MGGDFGLATRIEHADERKHTICGTPNYIAPEVLKKKGHSFEADIWSIGCILFTLLVGKPPFETNALKETYSRIMKNEYNVPKSISSNAKKLIVQLLQFDPALRPAIGELLEYQFMLSGYKPSQLPLSCLSLAPRFEGQETNSNDSNLQELIKQLTSVIKSNPSTKADFAGDEIEDPKSSPIFWITQWVDYSNKYGFGYALCDHSVGVVFRDKSKLLLFADKITLQYVNEEGHEEYHKLEKHTSDIDKKVKILHKFMDHMNQLVRAGSKIELKEGDAMSRVPSIKKWFRTTNAVVMYLTNGTLQINFFGDHCKIIVCPFMGAVTFIDGQQNHKTLSLQMIQKYGCSEKLIEMLKYASEKLNTILRCSNTM